MLDPADWARFRVHAHRALDDALDAMQHVRERPVWQAVPDETKALLDVPLPQEPTDFAAVYEEFAHAILPYATGNTHPRFFGWVHGSGTPGGAVADLLAAAMNANVGGRDHAAVYVERQIIAWFRTLFGFPDDASGVLLTGTSAATAAAVQIARTKALGAAVRRDGVDATYGRLIGYASAATHRCLHRAFEAAGLGSSAVHTVPVDRDHRIDLVALRAAIRRDRAAGHQPFLLVGNAGTVDVGAIDPLDALADLAANEGLWFHVDGAIGAPAYLAPAIRPRLVGIERADSIGFDFHKWLHVPYDVGCILVRDRAAHEATFASESDYLAPATRGVSGGAPWFTNLSPELSRGFRALKVWFTIKEHGAQKLGDAIERNCAQARYLASLVESDPAFELAAPAGLNIVCFRYHSPDFSPPELDVINDEIVLDVQESGVAVTSATTIGSRRVIRACITNHRSRESDFPILLDVLRVAGEARTASRYEARRSVGPGKAATAASTVRQMH